jgi:hypothetical protein
LNKLLLEKPAQLVDPWVTDDIAVLVEKPCVGCELAGIETEIADLAELPVAVFLLFCFGRFVLDEFDKCFFRGQQRRVFSSFRRVPILVEITVTQRAEQITRVFRRDGHVFITRYLE